MYSWQFAWSCMTSQGLVALYITINNIQGIVGKFHLLLLSMCTNVSQFIQAVLNFQMTVRKFAKYVNELLPWSLSYMYIRGMPESLKIVKFQGLDCKDYTDLFLSLAKYYQVFTHT